MTDVSPALALLLNRRSDSMLVEPGPSRSDIELMLTAASRVPDYQQLKPYRFILAEGEGRARLGHLMQQAAEQSGKTEAVQQRSAKLPLRAPLVITVVCSPDMATEVPLFDQQLSAGCTVLTLQLAARALGFGAVWRSGWLMHEPALAGLLGLSTEERIVGFLYVGTVPDLGLTRERPPLAAEKISWL